MEKEIGLSEFRSSYGNTHEEEEASDDEEWQTACPSTSNYYSRQSAMFPPAKKRRIDSSLSNPKLQNTILATKPSMQPDFCLGHSRTIIHVDIDCFYAQVEMIRNPKLRDLPLGIQQKHIVVTCNYVARKHGVKKLSFVSDAKRKCPEIVLVNGEDLAVYREFSGKVHALLTRDFTPLVEKLGMDENFLDVTELVNSRMESPPLESTDFSGAVYSRSSDSNEMKVIWNKCTTTIIDTCYSMGLLCDGRYILGEGGEGKGFEARDDG